MVFAAKLYAWLLKIPNVLSYHTHVPSYLPRYGLTWLVKSFWLFLRVLHGSAHLTLTTSPAMKEELVDFKVVQEKAVQVGLVCQDHCPWACCPICCTIGGYKKVPMVAYAGTQHMNVWLVNLLSQWRLDEWTLFCCVALACLVARRRALEGCCRWHGKHLHDWP